MKTLTKKAIVLASAIAVAGTFAVCAAGVTVGTENVIADVTTTSRSVVVPFATTDLAATDQITILAYNTDLGATPTEGNIVFIDQVEKGTQADITFSLRSDDPTGNYKVLMGGTGVTEAGWATFALESDAPSTFTINGKVVGSGIEVTDPDVLAVLPYADNYGFKINLKSADQTQILKTATVTIDGSDAVYTFTDVDPGDYALQIYKVGAVIRNIPITVVDANLSVPDKDLYSGAILGKVEVGAGDTSTLFANFGSDAWGTSSSSGNEYNIVCDLDFSGDVGGSDTSKIFVYAGNDLSFYGETETIDTWDETIE